MIKRLMVFIMGLSLVILTGCSSASVNVKTKENVLLTSAPVIKLSDPLSSTLNEFEVQPGNYTWNYLNGEETVSMIACGSHPLETVQNKEEKLKLLHSNEAGLALYTFSCVVEPDKIIVNEWDISQIGSTEATVLSSTTYEDTFIIEFKPDRVYEIIATWNEKNLEANGFHGEASYVVVTEKK